MPTILFIERMSYLVGKNIVKARNICSEVLVSCTANPAMSSHSIMPMSVAPPSRVDQSLQCPMQIFEK